MSAHEPHTPSPADGRPVGARPRVRYDPVAPALPLGRPKPVAPAEPSTPPADPRTEAPAPWLSRRPSTDPPASTLPVFVAPAMPVRAQEAVRPLPDGVIDRARAVADLAEIDANLPKADAKGPGVGAELPVTPPPAHATLSEAAAADAAAMSWPPLADELDAVEVIDLEAIRHRTLPPRHPRVLPEASVAPSPRRALPEPPAMTPGTDRPIEASASGALAWPPSVEDVDAIAMIDLHAGAPSLGAAALGPVERTRATPVVPAAWPDEAPAAPARFSRPVIIGLIVTCVVVGSGYVVMQRQPRDRSGVNAPSSDTARVPPQHAAAVTSPQGPSLDALSGPGAATATMPDASAEASLARAPAESPDVVAALAASRRLLAMGDRVNAVRTMLSAPPGPTATEFVAGVIRGAAADAELARTATLARVATGEALDTFRAASEQQSNAVVAWRQGQFARALDLFNRAARAYDAIEAPRAASATTPVGVTGRTLDVPPAATRDEASRPEMPLPPTVPPTVPATTSGVPAARDMRTMPNLAPPVADARPVTVSRPDEAGVRRTLEAYRSAFDRLDADAATAVVPSIDGKALARAFAGLTSQRLEFERCDVDVTDVTAQATCVGRAATVPKVGSSKPRVDPRRWSFVLAREGDGWQITSARVAQR